MNNRFEREYVEMNKYKIPVIGKMIEHREADKKADALLKKYDFYKTEDAM